MGDTENEKREEKGKCGTGEEVVVKEGAGGGREDEGQRLK